MVDVLMPFPTPVITRPAMNCARVFVPSKQVTWITAPMIMITEPRIMPLRLPRRSPLQRMSIAPMRHPISYIAVTNPCIVGLFRVSGNMAAKAGALMIPDITPWSYPNNKNPVVATADTVIESGLPDRPMNLGGAIVHDPALEGRRLWFYKTRRVRR